MRMQTITHPHKPPGSLGYNSFHQIYFTKLHPRCPPERLFTVQLIPFFRRNE